MKYHFEGIGEAGAATIIAGLSANPNTIFLTKGFVGKIIFFLLKRFCMFLADKGLIVMNLGAAKVQTIADKGTFDGSWDTAEKLIEGIRNEGRELTDEEIKEIDQQVIDAFRKFANFGRVRQRRHS